VVEKEPVHERMVKRGPCGARRGEKPDQVERASAGRVDDAGSQQRNASLLDRPSAVRKQKTEIEALIYSPLAATLASISNAAFW